MHPGDRSALPMLAPLNATAIACQIGDELTATAVFAGDRCTWTARDISEQRDPNTPIIPTTRSLRAELYSGTAGVALFLAQLDACAGWDTRRERVVYAALAHALYRADSDHLSGGFFDGLCGIGHAAVRIGEIYGDIVCVRKGLELLERGTSMALCDSAIDVVSGLAGVILVLAHHASGYAPLAAPLERCSETLSTRAITRDETWRWPATGGFGAAKHCLTGFSHGAAGIAAALLASYAVTGNAEYRRGAIGTMRYEDSWFLSEEQNWPDLRSFDGDRLPTRRRARARLTCARTWCHGAPGILLTRALAARLVPASEGEALTSAIATTIAESQAWAPGADTSPCHGASGLVECLLHATQGAPALPARRAQVAARTLLQRMLEANVANTWWASGVPSGGRNQSLMLGMAGVGYQLLRWDHNAAVPSILFPYSPTLHSTVLQQELINSATAAACPVFHQPDQKLHVASTTATPLPSRQ